MNDKKCCPMSCLISIVAVFIFLNLFNWAVHGLWLMPDYQATAPLWRTQEDMQGFHVWWLLYFAAMAVITTCFFKKFCKGYAACHCGPSCPCGMNCPCKQAVATKKSCPIQTGLCFGLKLGLILGLPMASSYLYMPIPLALAVKWLVAGVLEGLGIGLVLGMLSGGKGKSCGVNACTPATPSAGATDI